MHDNDVNVIDWDRGQRVSSVFTDVEDEKRESITAFCINPINSDDIVVATQNYLLRQYQLSTKLCGRTIRTQSMPTLTMDFDPSGTLVATGSSDFSVRVWDISKGYCTHVFKDHTDSIHMVQFHKDPNQMKLFSQSYDNTIRIYDLIESSAIACFRDHMSLPTGMHLSEDGYIMATVGRDKVLHFHCRIIKLLLQRL